jgi:hypothetical protein
MDDRFSTSEKHKRDDERVANNKKAKEQHNRYKERQRRNLLKPFEITIPPPQPPSRPLP